MKIKHSKFKNTGLLYEFLVHQIAADTITNVKSPAVQILRNYFKESSLLSKEYKLYEFIIKNRGIGKHKAETILSTITQISSKLDQKKLRELKYSLVSEIKKHYPLEEFFSRKVVEYKTMAGLYCLLEAQNNSNLVNPSELIENKTTILEYLTNSTPTQESVRQSLIEEYSTYDKDLKLLTYKVLLEKFNNKYKDLTLGQKEILREFISASGSSTKLRDFTNKKIEDIRQELTLVEKKITDPILKIKINEVLKNLPVIPKGRTVKEENITLLMKYYELIKELRVL